LKKKIILVLVAISLVFVSGCNFFKNPNPELSQEELYKIELVKEIQEFEKNFGFKETANFQKYDPQKTAYYLYYYTKKTFMPYSYEDPRLFLMMGFKKPKEPNSEKYDVFLYECQAVAGGKTITKALMDAPIHRILEVVAHEDFHEQINFPLGVEEPIVTLVGYLVAMEFAKFKFGEDSDVYKHLESGLEVRLALAPIFVKYHGLLTNLYLKYKLGELSREETLLRKEALYEGMEAEFLEGGFKIKSHLNNAFLAYEITYDRYFLLAYEVYSATDCDVLETIEIFMNLPRDGDFFISLGKIKQIEKEVMDYLKDVIENKS